MKNTMLALKTAIDQMDYKEEGVLRIAGSSEISKVFEVAKHNVFDDMYFTIFSVNDRVDFIKKTIKLLLQNGKLVFHNSNYGIGVVDTSDKELPTLVNKFGQFIKLIIQNVATTRMDSHNIAVVMAPWFGANNFDQSKVFEQAIEQLLNEFPVGQGLYNDSAYAKVANASNVSRANAEAARVASFGTNNNGNLSKAPINRNSVSTGNPVDTNKQNKKKIL